jgi:small subunit ribosomal protein S9
MADDRDDETPQDPTAGEEQPVEETPAEPEATTDAEAADDSAAPDRQAAEAAAAQEPVAETLAAQSDGEESGAAEDADDAAAAPAAEAAPAPAADDAAAAPAAEAAPAPAADDAAAAPAAEAAAAPAADDAAAAPAAAEQPAAEADTDELDEEDDEEPAPRVKPEIPGADLEVDIVTEGTDPFGRGESAYDEDEEPEPVADEVDEVPDDQPIAAVAIDLAAGARYRATGKRKTAVARVTLKPGDGSYVINGRSLEEFFPRGTLQRNIRQPLEAVGYEARMDVIARMHGGGVSAQAGALRHGISRALLEADPNLRGELKRRGFLTRDPRVKERKKAGLKKARKRPQFSKR